MEAIALKKKMCLGKRAPLSSAWWGENRKYGRKHTENNNALKINEIEDNKNNHLNTVERKGTVNKNI